MPVYFVTRHQGAVEWAARRGIEAERVEHLDSARIAAGDVVLGTLPVSVAADVCAAGGRYVHLTLPVPSDMRGRELSADDMDRFGARLEEFVVRRIEWNR